jgi:hypothetical protein
MYGVSWCGSKYTLWIVTHVHTKERIAHNMGHQILVGEFQYKLTSNGTKQCHIFMEVFLECICSIINHIFCCIDKCIPLIEILFIWLIPFRPKHINNNAFNASLNKVFATVSRLICRFLKNMTCWYPYNSGLFHK